MTFHVIFLLVKVVLGKLHKVQLLDRGRAPATGVAGARLRPRHQPMSLTKEAAGERAQPRADVPHGRQDIVTSRFEIHVDGVAFEKPAAGVRDDATAVAVVP